MKTQAKAGIGALGLVLLAGIWLFLAPLIVGYQNNWKTLIDATKNDLWSGGVLIAIAALTLTLFATFALRDAARAARRGKLQKEKGAAAGQED